jgi:NAD(P)-dependent dehydrogenase (short-subunit alcohol dehydrogenase family)
VDLAGQTFVVTGASRGIGFSAGLVLLDWGGTVVFAVRDVAKCQRAILAATSDPDQRQRAEVVHLDLSSFASVRKFSADTFIKPARRCHCLINNAHCSGLVAQLATVDGVEHSYQVNYLSHFLLTLLLMPALATTFGEGGVGASPQQCGPSFSRPGSTGTQVAGRVVHVTSRTYALAGPVRRDAYSPSARHLGSEFYRPDKVYGDTKLMQVLFSKELTAQVSMPLSVY